MEIITPNVFPLPIGGSKDSIEPNVSDREIPQRFAEKPVETINDLLLSKVRENPDSVFLSYPATPRGKSDYVDYTLAELDEFVDEAARKYVAGGLLPEASEDAPSILHSTSQLTDIFLAPEQPRCRGRRNSGTFQSRLRRFYLCAISDRIRNPVPIKQAVDRSLRQPPEEDQLPEARCW